MVRRNRYHGPGKQKLIAFTLMISFLVIMRDEILNGSSERCFPEQEGLIESIAMATTEPQHLSLSSDSRVVGNPVIGRKPAINLPDQITICDFPPANEPTRDRE